MGLARQRLGPLFLPKVDPEDIVQSVFRTVFRRLAEKQFDLQSWNDLWGLLIRITCCKCCKWQEHFTAQCRDVRREAAPANDAEAFAVLLEFLDREPTADQALVLKETLALALGDLKGKDKDI